MSFCVGALALSGPNRDDLYAHNYCVVDFAPRATSSAPPPQFPCFPHAARSDASTHQMPLVPPLVFKAVRLRICLQFSNSDLGIAPE